jgi:hypothetical protein
MSDARQKQNIKTSTKAGKDLIGKLRVRDYEWKHKPGKVITGLIAQDALEDFPDIVGDPDLEDGMYSISLTSLIPYLIKHNQDQQAEIDALEARVRELEDQ